MKFKLACFILIVSLGWASIASADNKPSESSFLQDLIENNTPVSIFLVNGLKLQGRIEENNKDVIFLKNTISQMVYKHAISTIVPSIAE